MAEELNVIIDRPPLAGLDVAVTEAWLNELQELETAGHQVGAYIKRAQELLKEAQALAPVKP